MRKIFIFSGTSEGRELSEFLSEKQIEHKVFVATEYGRIVMKESPYAQVCMGKLDKEEMTELFRTEKPEKVYDATHPYAVEVSENIKEAMEKAGYGDRLERIERKLDSMEKLCSKVRDNTSTSRSGGKDVEIGFCLKTAASVDEAKRLLADTKGNILLTTGVKTLHEYMADARLRDRIAARILPSEESLSLAVKTGIAPGKIIAMEGPFSTSMNEALIDQYHISVMVTKNSGVRGGFPQKFEACRNKGIMLLVVEGAKKISGKSLEEARSGISAQEKQRQILTVAGVGVGDERSLTIEAVRRIKEAELLIGADRMLTIAEKYNSDALRDNVYVKDEVIRSVKEHGFLKNVYLVSGDTGFFSGASAIEEMSESQDRDLDIEILPGISSISYLCALAGLPYSGARLLSSHGRKMNIGEELEKRENFFAIMSGKDDFNSIVGTLKEQNVKCLIIKGCNLGMPDQTIEKIRIEDFIPADKEGLYVIGVIYDGQ